MSRQNKVNPGQYTSAGRLSPDDLGREMRRQRSKVASAPGAMTKPPAWETTPPAPKLPARRRAASTAPPGRLKVAGARAANGVARVTAGAAKAVTGAAAKVVGAKRRRTSATAPKPAAAKAPSTRKR